MIEKQDPKLQTPSGFFRHSSLTYRNPPNREDEMDRALSLLQEKKQEWANLPLIERINILDDILLQMRTYAPEWASLSCDAKGNSGNAYAEAEEWAFVTIIFRMVRLLRKSLLQIRKYGHPLIPGPLRRRSNGQVVAQVFPQSFYDRLLLPGTSAEVWMQPGVTPEEVVETQASFYRSGKTEGKVALVLGAGNASMLIPSDILYQLFVEGSVILLKLNPVNDYLGPLVEKTFRSLIKPGYLRIIYGGSKEGSYLCLHNDVEEIHTTGSDKTYEDIVFGPGEEGRLRKAQKSPRITKRFTAELGNVTPIIIVPGSWSHADVYSQAERLASWLVINAGFNCLTPRLIIQWAGWSQRAELNQAIEEILGTIPTRAAYYPGAEKRQQRYLDAHPEARKFAREQKASHLPWVFIPGLDPANSEDICFRNESFCGLFAETDIQAGTVEEFLKKAARFANEQLWGNLTATIVAHPQTLKDPQLSLQVEQCIADLHYGMVLVNQFAGLGFMAITTTWGAYPGNSIYDIQSGTGITTNALMFALPEKSIVRSPFRLSPDPLLASSRRPKAFARQLAAFQYHPSVVEAAKLTWLAMRS